MCWFPVVMGMKFFYHFHTERSNSKQQNATETYRETQTEFTYDIKKNGIKVKDGVKIDLLKSNTPDNFYTGSFRIVYMLISKQKKYVSKLL